MALSIVSPARPPYFNPTLFASLMGIPHMPYFLPVGFGQGNNSFGVESPTRSNQTKKRKRDRGVTLFRKRKGELTTLHGNHMRPSFL